MTRNSSASYTLRIRCSRLELLGEILGAISAQKNVTLDHLNWRYPDLKPVQKEWLDSCIAEARERAAHIAEALGVKLFALHSFTEVWHDSEDTAPIRHPRPAAAAGLRAVQELTREIDLGFNLSHSKMIEQRVDLTYVVDPRELTAEPQQP